MKHVAPALALALSGCGGTDVPDPLLQPEARGPCTLRPLVSGIPIVAPYVVTMAGPPGGIVEAGVEWKATGWSGTVQMGVVAPRGRLDSLGQDAQSLNQGRMAQVFNEPGTWALEFEDRNCFQRVIIEVRPPGG